MDLKHFTPKNKNTLTSQNNKKTLEYDRNYDWKNNNSNMWNDKKGYCQLNMQIFDKKSGFQIFVEQFTILDSPSKKTQSNFHLNISRYSTI